MRVRWRLTFNPISRKPVPMKLTDQGYTNACLAKEFSTTSGCRAKIYPAPFGLITWFRWHRCGMGILFFRFRQFGQHSKIFQCSCVAGNLCAAGDFLEKPSHDFAAARFRERFSETQFIRLCDRFFFQAEDGIRDLTVTGVQTCALPICSKPSALAPGPHQRPGGSPPLSLAWM